MASKLTYKRTLTDKVSVKGILSDDGMYITYQDEDKNEQDVKIADLLHTFRGNSIDFSVSLKSESDLDVIPADDDETDE